jgi:fluoroquinolone transport system permease protein
MDRPQLASGGPGHSKKNDMKFLISLSLNDLRCTFRDPVFKALLFFPFISYGIIAWVLPAVIHRWPVVQAYSDVILMWACMQSSTMFGFIYGFLFLEEKEENIDQALRVVPVSGIMLVFSRLLIGIGISFLVSMVLFHFGRVVRLPLIEEILLSFLYSLSAPVITLLLAAFARNRIEGLAQMKMVNILLMLPGLIYFLPYKALDATAMIPTYWSFRATEMAIRHSDSFLLYMMAGFFMQLGIIFFLNRRLEKEMPG